MTDSDWVNIAKRIETGCRQYVENYWKKIQNGEDVKTFDREAFSELLEQLGISKVKDSKSEKIQWKSDKAEKVRQILDRVAKKYMFKYYNMLLSQTVLKYHFV